MPKKPTHRSAILALILVAASLFPAVAQPADLASLVSATGLRTIQPPTQATELDLPDLQGQRSRLSSYQGQWVLLTFFAAWCGPCRSEMPSLQRLHDSLEGQDFKVLGVSIDQTSNQAKRFVDDLGVRFPVLWDESGAAARAYQANSIPLSYLIDPSGRVVGVARGARDWSSSRVAFANLLAAGAGEGFAESAEYAANREPTELSPTLTPPTATWHLSESQPRSGEPFPLQVRIEWAGTLRDYLLHPPEVALPEGVLQSSISAESNSLEGRSVLTYEIVLQIDEPGLYDLDPIQIRYTPAFESTPVATQIAGPTVEIPEITWAGMSPSVALVVGSTALLAMLGLGAWIALKRRPTPPGPDDDYERLMERFSTARHRRLEGDIAGFLELLISIGEELGESEPDEELAALYEQVRYGGVAPPSQILDHRQRALERRIEETRPAAEVNQLRFSPGAERRASIATREEVSR